VVTDGIYWRILQNRSQFTRKIAEAASTDKNIFRENRSGALDIGSFRVEPKLDSSNGGKVKTLSLVGIFFAVTSSDEACDGNEGINGKLFNTGADVGWIRITGGIKADGGETGTGILIGATGTGILIGTNVDVGGIKADGGETGTGILIGANVGLFVGAADGINLQPTPSNGVQLTCALIGSSIDPAVKRKLSVHSSPVTILLFRP
jgi:hypothetical protein